MLDEEHIEEEPVRSVRPLELLLLELVSKIEFLCSCFVGDDSFLLVAEWVCERLLSAGWERFRDDWVDEIDNESLLSDTDSALELCLLASFSTFKVIKMKIYFNFYI